jgi:predicted flap endonuclease-1-like 5' DNA nuclease
VDEEGFRTFLKRGGRSPSAVKRCIVYVQEFERYLQAHAPGQALAEARIDQLDGFVEWIEQEPRTSAKGHLWALRYYFDYVSDAGLRDHASALRQERIQRTPFPLRRFRGVDPDHAEALATLGIENVDQMRGAGRTPRDRQVLAERTGIPPHAILELVKLSDLARVAGLKGIRARLYHDAGVDTVEKLAAWEPEALRAMLVEFVERTGFDGIAPLPKEAAGAVAQAKKLPLVVEY